MRRTLILILCLAAVLTATVAVSAKIGKNEFYYTDKHSSKSSAGSITPIGDISDYDKLIAALKSMIRTASVSERLTVFDYDGDLMTDLQKATDYLTKTYPIGNYAVSSIVYSPHYVASYCELQILINYTHTYEEINTIAHVLSRDELEERIGDALRSFSGKTVFDISGLEVDEDNIGVIFEKCWLQSDVYAYGLSKAEFAFYPKGAQDCLLEMVLSYGSSKEELINTVSVIQDIINDMAESFTGSGIAEKIAFTESYLESNVDPDAESAFSIAGDYVFEKVLLPDTAVGALGEGPASRLGTVMAASALLKGLGAENKVITGKLANGDRAVLIFIDDKSEGGSGLFYDPGALYDENGEMNGLYTYEEAERIFFFDKDLFGI